MLRTSEQPPRSWNYVRDVLRAAERVALVPLLGVVSALHTTPGLGIETRLIRLKPAAKLRLPEPSKLL